jgi:hypothetical protein
MAEEHRFLLGVALAIGVLAVAPPASGQEQAAPAESLFEEGRMLLAQQRYPEACAKLAESQKLDPAVGTLLNLGDCYEKMGKIATAWAVFKEATTLARSGKQPGREKIAAARADALVAKIPRLSISVPHAPLGLAVQRDGVAVGQTEWSGPAASAVTIDPGDHVIVVTAPGKKAWSTKVALSADGKTTAIEVPELEPDELADRAPLKPASDSAVSLEVVNAHDRNVQRVIGLATAGAGLVTLIIGIPFGVRAINLNKDAASECPTNTTCQGQGGSDAQSAQSSSVLSTILVVGGAGVAVGGAIVYLTAPKPKHEPVPKREPAPKTSLQVLPEVSPRGAGLRFLGSF